MQTETPKPFLRIGGKTILEHTISRFTSLPNLVQVIVATSADYFANVEQILSSFSDSCACMVVEGGEERQFSIYNALKNVSQEAQLVAVHDAVRPFIRKELIAECCKVAEVKDGAVVGVPAKDTIKEVNENREIISTPDRSRLWQAQTPQIFQKHQLLKAYESASKNNFIGTDDASLVEKIGGHVQMVEGDRENLKITYPVDLKIAELILGGEQ